MREEPPILQKGAKIAMTVLDPRDFSKLQLGEVVLARVNVMSGTSWLLSVSLIGTSVSGWISFDGGMGWVLLVGASQALVAVTEVED